MVNSDGGVVEIAVAVTWANNDGGLVVKATAVADGGRRWPLALTLVIRDLF